MCAQCILPNNAYGSWLEDVHIAPTQSDGPNPYRQQLQGDQIVAMTPEGKVQKYCATAFKRLGALVRKCSWEGRNGAPDLIVFLNNMVIFIEVKKEGEKPRPNQLKEHERMRQRGAKVHIVDSVAGVNKLVARYSLDVI